MGEIKKLCIKRFDSIIDIENFYNTFSKTHNIVSKDVKIVHVEKSKPNFMLILEYLA